MAIQITKRAATIVKSAAEVMKMRPAETAAPDAPPGPSDVGIAVVLDVSMVIVTSSEFGADVGISVGADVGVGVGLAVFASTIVRRWIVP